MVHRHDEQHLDSSKAKMHKRIFFASPVFCTKGVCWRSEHLPKSYENQISWVLDANYELLAQYLPPDWIPDFDCRHTPAPYVDAAGGSQPGFEWQGLFGCAGTTVRDDLLSEDLLHAWDGCKVISDEGKYYVYASFKRQLFLRRNLLPDALCSLKDLCFGFLFMHPMDLSGLTEDLKEEVQRRTCPQDQHARGFQEIKTWHYNGNLCQKIPLNLAGQFHGEAEMWDPRGRRMVSVDFKNGKMDGKVATWNEDGGGGDWVTWTYFKDGLPVGRRIMRDPRTGRAVAWETFSHTGCEHRVHSRIFDMQSKWRLYIQHPDDDKTCWIKYSFKNRKTRDDAAKLDLEIPMCDCNQRKRKKPGL